MLDANFAVDADGVSDIGNTHFYTGRELDAETGLQLNRHRFYGSHIGRWLTRDPIGYDDRTHNLYLYTDGSPVTRVDPDGEWWWIIIPILPALGCGKNPPPPLPPCVRVPGAAGRMPSTPTVGWLVTNIGSCYTGCRGCNPRQRDGNHRLRCTECCQECFTIHKGVCAAVPLHPSCQRRGPEIRLNGCNTGCLAY